MPCAWQPWVRRARSDRLSKDFIQSICEDHVVAGVVGPCNVSGRHVLSRAADLWMAQHREALHEKVTENLLRMGSPSEKKVAKKLASTCVDCMSKGHLSVTMHVKRQLFANIEWRGLHKHAKRKATCCHIDFVT